MPSQGASHRLRRSATITPQVSGSLVKLNPLVGDGPAEQLREHGTPTSPGQPTNRNPPTALMGSGGSVGARAQPEGGQRFVIERLKSLASSLRQVHAQRNGSSAAR